MPRARLLSLCTGYGGLDLAVEAVLDVELVAMAEFDVKASLVAETRFPGVPNLGDIKAIDWDALDDIDIITAGYPCQPFSQAGKRLGEEDPRHIWPHIAEGIRILRPGLVILENVSGHRSKGFGTVLGDLATLGYDVRWASIRASDVGAPHRRERVFIVAADTRSKGRQGSGSAEAGLPKHAGGDALVVANTDSERLTGGTQRHSEPIVREDGQPGDDADGLGVSPWGTYEPAIRRWEQLTRPASDPLDNQGRLSPLFVEWMMGLPDGWVTGVVDAKGKPLAKTHALKILGNGVVPQQAAYALGSLLVGWKGTEDASS